MIGTSAVHVGITYRYDCRACTSSATVQINVAARDPVFAPEHYLPERWFILHGYPVCPRHTLTIGPREEGC